jgi:hypothetical protein
MERKRGLQVFVSRICVIQYENQQSMPQPRSSQNLIMSLIMLFTNSRVSTQCSISLNCQLFLFHLPSGLAASAARRLAASAFFRSASSRFFCCSCVLGKSEFQNPGGFGSVSQFARCLDTSWRCCCSAL